MAKILFAPSNALQFDGNYILTGKYEEICNELVRYGNEVLVYIPNKFHKKVFWGENELFDHISEEDIISEIKNFNPDLVITFNNCIYYNILKIVDCYIVIWDADVDYMWSQIDIIKNNVDRYIFFCFSTSPIESRRKYFGANANQMFHMRLATNFKNYDIPKINNISFIGTNFTGIDEISQLIKKYSGTKEIKSFLEVISSLPDINISKEYVIKYLKEKVVDFSFISEVAFLDERQWSSAYRSEHRLHDLLNIYDLGLDLYGDSSWINIEKIFPSLGACFKNEKIITSNQNEIIYNSHKINLNICIGNKKNAMPYRVPDIMATSGCIVSSYSLYIKNSFKNIKIPFFDNAHDARLQCKKILLDDQYRNDIILKCNDEIDRNWRWVHRFKEMESILNINMFPNKLGKCIIMEPIFQYIDDCSQSKIKSLSQIKIRKISNELIKILPYFLAKKILKK